MADEARRLAAAATQRIPRGNRKNAQGRFLLPTAILGMTVEDADGLQIGIDDGGANEGHPPFFKILGDGVGEGRGGALGEWLPQELSVGKAPNFQHRSTIL